MKWVESLALKSLVFLAIAGLNFVTAPAQNAPQRAAQGEKNDSRTHNLPQDFVVCTGWRPVVLAELACADLSGKPPGMAR